MKKRISAALLCVVLCLAMLGTSAFAATPSVSLSGTSGGNSVTVTASGLTPNTTYHMCSVSKGNVLLALFNATTDATGSFTQTVTVGPLSANDALAVAITDPATGDSAVNGSGTITSTPTPTPPPEEPDTPDHPSGGSSGGSSSSSSSSSKPKVTAGTGGKVTVSSDGRTVTITPYEGYRVKDVIINGESVGSVTSYTFKKASKSNTVEVIFEKIDADGAAFSDVTNHWARAAIEYVVGEGLFNGVSATQFAPDQPMTRAMLVTVLHRAAGTPAGGGNAFSDVPAGQWYTDAVSWAAANGIVTGVGNGRFNPDGNITREELATILYRYAKGTPAGDLSAFNDAGKVSSWASDAMRWAVSEGVITGKPGNVIDPQGNATRAEVATMLQRFLAK